MESLEEEVITELRDLIAYSCSMNKEGGFNDFHSTLIKYCYKAVDVRLDTKKNRVYMNIIADEAEYHSMNINTGLTLIPASFHYDNLVQFLRSCIVTNGQYLLPYASLISKYRPEHTYLVH